MPSNGEVEGPADHVPRASRARNLYWVPRRPSAADQAPRAHNLSQRPRRQAAVASRPPPTIVRPHHKRCDAPLRVRGRIDARKTQVHSRAALHAPNEESSTPGASACSVVGFHVSLPTTCGLTTFVRHTTAGVAETPLESLPAPLSSRRNLYDLSGVKNCVKRIRLFLSTQLIPAAYMLHGPLAPAHAARMERHGTP